MTRRDAWLRVRALFAPRRAERELHEELAFHIERETQKQVASGVGPAAARARALARFGSMPLAADQCRDVRGTSAIDALARDVAYAWRTFRRAPLAAATIVGTVALGLGLVTVVFTLFNFSFLRVDAVRNAHELYSVQEPERSGGESQRPLTRADYDAIRTETSVFADVAAILRPVRTRVDGRVVSGALVTGNFFEMVGVDAVRGRVLTRDDDRMNGRPVVVLSHRGWGKLFAADPNVIGRTVRINGVPFEVAGVLPEDFRGLSLAPPDYWAPLALAGQLRDGYTKNPETIAVEVVGRLVPGTSREAAAAALSLWASRRADPPHASGRSTVMTLRPRSGTLSADLLEIVAVATPLFFSFGLVLMIGCANVANLLLASGVARQRELGIRLALGASRRRVIRQLLTENLLLALIAAACGLGVSRLFMEGAIYAVARSMPPELTEQVSVGAPSADWRVVVFVVAGAVVSTMFFGLVPALQATRLELVRTMRGDVTKTARPGRARHALIAVQVGASALLLICAGVFLRSAASAARLDPGVRTSDTVKVYVANESRRAALLQAVAAHPLVTAVAASSAPARAVASTAIGDQPERASERRVAVQQILASAEYFDVIGLNIMAGRGFTPAERRVDASVAVVSETAARELWPDSSALGQVVHVQLSPSDARESTEPVRAFTIVGVMRDVNGPLAPDFFPSWGVYLPASTETAGTSLTLRVRGDPEQARQTLVEHLTGIDPGLGEVSTMRTIAGLQTYILQIAFWVAVVLGGFALVLTVSGLFSVLSYVVALQTKEIGLRVALGATTKTVARLVIVQAFRSVSIGLVAGTGLAAAVATLLLSTPSASEIGNLVQVLDPVAYITGVLVIVSACLLASSLPTLRAARIDPIAALRNE